ncbi:MAG TPA: hypothetical protein VGM88_33885 [Kofleriaceae bacterium]|jgi:hypothetical protein
MRSVAPAVFVLVAGACHGGGSGGTGGSLGLQLDRPGGNDDPTGYTSIDVTVHSDSGDTERSASITDDSFDLGDIDPMTGVWVEATLRDEGGAAVGYGRSAAPVDLAAGGDIELPVRRPTAYVAGPASTTNDDLSLTWRTAAATFSDLSQTGSFTGTTQLSGTGALVVSAGPDLYLAQQGVDTNTGAFTGDATILPVSAADHSLGGALSGTVPGAVADGAGTDDGSAIVIATASGLYEMDTTAGGPTMLAAGNFSRIAIVREDGGLYVAYAIKNRGSTSTACPTSAELWRAPLAMGGDGPPGSSMLATGGFTDVAADRGHAYYVTCAGELGEVTAGGTSMISSISLSSGTKTTALAVSNGLAFFGLEMHGSSVSVGLGAVNIATKGDQRTLWNEESAQVVDTQDNHDVQRLLPAQYQTIEGIEVGAGDDYIALTTIAHFDQPSVFEANFPAMTIDTEELRVFEAATGSSVQRFLAYCEGIIDGTGNPDAIEDWECATSPGQIEAPAGKDHTITSLAFLFGKK